MTIPSDLVSVDTYDCGQIPKKFDENNTLGRGVCRRVVLYIIQGDLKLTQNRAIIIPNQQFNLS